MRVFQSTITSYRQADQGDVDDITKQMDMNIRRLNIDKARRPVLNISGHRSLASPNLGAGREITSLFTMPAESSKRFDDRRCQC